MTHDLRWAPALAGAVATSSELRNGLGRAAHETHEKARDSADLDVLFGELAESCEEAERQRPLGALYDAVAADLYGIALWRTESPADAADVVQTVFVRLAEGRVRFGRVRNPRLFLLAMAHRAAVDLVRRRRPAVALDELSVAEALLVEPVSAAAGAEAAELSRWLLELPVRQREALYLRYFAGLTFREIGRVAGVPTFTAASRCRLGLSALRRRARVPADAGPRRDDA
jgi:RNA polymerase sigma-70 factor (ECF subfamily)